MPSTQPLIMIEDYKGGVVSDATFSDRHVEEFADSLRKLTADWPGVHVDVQLDKDRDFLSIEVTGLLTGDQHAAIHQEVGREANRIQAAQESNGRRRRRSARRE
jgi:hypothetical protein